MREIIERRSRIRRGVAWLALASIAALLVLPPLAWAAENLVVSSSVPDDWNVTFDDPGLFHVNGFYARMGTIDTEYGPSAQALWKGEGRVSVTISTGDTMFLEDQYSSWEDFQSRSNEGYSADVTYSWDGAQRTTIGGHEAYLNVGTASYDRAWVAWVPLAEGGVSIKANAWAEGTEAATGFDEVVGDVQGVLGSLQFRDLAGAGASAGLPTLPGDDGDTSPWRTVTGGVAAVAAAAIALAGAAASARTKSGAQEPAPDQPVGYVLQLSARSLTVSAEHSASFTVQAFKVLPNGSFQPATDAAIVLHLPAGVSVQPQTAYGTLQAVVWQTGAMTPGASITVEAQASLGSTTAAVTVSPAGESRIVTRIEPASTIALSTQGGQSITLVAAVELLGADATDAALDPATIRASIEFAEDSEWLDISVATDYEDGRAITVMASQPDPTSPVQPPESATLRVTAWIGERPLTELVSIPLAGLPEIDAKPDSVSLAAESGSSAEVAVTITNGGEVPWQFETEWREGSRAIAVPDIVPTGPAAATLTITESGSDQLDPTRAETASTLVVVASAEGFEPLRRQVSVIVSQEGLFIDRTNVDPSTGAFAVAADGSGRPTEIDLRVFVRDPSTGEIAPDIGLAQQATLEIGGQEGTSGQAGLQAGVLRVAPAGVRALNIPSATFAVTLERKLPTAGEPVPAALRASVAGYDEDRFSALVPLRLLGVNMEPYSAAWEIERDNCLDIIRAYVPAEHQERLYNLVAERSLTMGAEGLFSMRKQIWSFAYDQLMKEKHEHLDAAWWAQQIEDTLDWVSWCGDIALGVASGAYLGVVGSIAIGMLKPLLVSAMEVWLAGGSLEDWLLAQTSTLTGVLEGGLTDPDVLAKMGGDKKAIGWALFIAYYFAKEIYNDPQMSVTNAMKNVGRQLRDEGLIMFLQKIAGMRGISVDAPRAKSAGADVGTPDAPRAKTATTPDAGRPKTTAGTPDATVPTRPAAPDTPDAPRTKTPAADAPAVDTPAQRTPDADAARPRDTEIADAKPDKTPDADTDKPAEAKPDKTPDADTDKPAEAKPDKKVPEQVVEKAPEAPVDKPDPRRASDDPAKRAETFEADVKSKTAVGEDGVRRVDLETMDKVMRDPDAARVLKKNNPDAWEAYNNKRQEVYTKHNAALKTWIETNVPDAKTGTVEIRDVGHSDGVDHDYRAGVVRTDPVTGREVFVEIPKEKWAPKSQEIFARETGGPTDPKGAAKWSKDRQQLQTDGYHAEASVDMADQGWVKNPETGTWERTQVTSNLELTENGLSVLKDPEGLGKTYETKVAEAYHEGNKLDAYRQAEKAVETLDKVEKGYSDQDYGIKDTPPKIKAGMDVIRDVNSGKLSPADAEIKLRSLEYGGLPDFMEKVSGRFGALKLARKA